MKTIDASPRRIDSLELNRQGSGRYFTRDLTMTHYINRPTRQDRDIKYQGRDPDQFLAVEDDEDWSDLAAIDGGRLDDIDARL